MFDDLLIAAPKRQRRRETGWGSFFPYYAGFPERFAADILQSAKLASPSIVVDPWNGSGTTTFAASKLGHITIGLDLNPAMVVIARARMLASSEADSLRPLGQQIVRGSDVEPTLGDLDPLIGWFDRSTASTVRSLERSICRHLIGPLTLSDTGVALDRVSGIAAIFYVVLFSVCRELVKPFLSSNPTWLRCAKRDDQLISVDRQWIECNFLAHIGAMANALYGRTIDGINQYISEVRQADATAPFMPAKTVDMVLTSPPYCTRIDYIAATRIELAVMAPLLNLDTIELSRRMMGSTRVPLSPIKIDERWGPTCCAFLDKVRCHPSKASAGYYLLTHADYFDKLARSMSAIASALKCGGKAIFVVQDSFYKDIHNDLPAIVAEIAKKFYLTLGRREDFYFRGSMAGINSMAKRYDRKIGAVESVLCFERLPGHVEQ